MFSIIWKLLEFGINRYSEYKLKRADSETEVARIHADVEINKTKWKARVLSQGGWWFQLFFIIPLAIWFSAVVFYSVFWCSTCMSPQPWVIAALPSPLNEWAGWIIGYLFLVNVGRRI